MNPIEPGWVALCMAISAAIVPLMAKIKEIFTQKKKEDQEGAAFLLTNYRETILMQDKKIVEMGQKLVDVQQKVVDIQTANVLTLTENMAMKKQIENLTKENTDLRSKIADLERRIA